MLNQPEIKQEKLELDFTRVLVVDDMPDNRMLMKLIFKNTSYNLTIASSAPEALEKAQTELPVLIVSDIQMPTISGLDLLENLKADDRTKDIAVILVTAHYRDSRQVSKGLTLGADDYIQRPFMPDEFLSRVDAVVRAKRAEGEARLQAHTVTQQNRALALVNELALAVNSSLDIRVVTSLAV